MEVKRVFDVVVTPDPQASVEFFRRCFGFNGGRPAAAMEE